MLRCSLPRVLCDGMSEAGAAEKVQDARARANDGGSEKRSVVIVTLICDARNSRRSFEFMKEHTPKCEKRHIRNGVSFLE